MKKTLSIALCLILLLTTIMPTYAADTGEVIYSQETVLEDGTILLDEVIVYAQTRSAVRTAERKATLIRDDVVIGIIAFQASFNYNGNTVSVASKTVTQTDTYEGWNYKQNSFTSGDGTVTLDAKLTKLLIFNVPFTMSLTCSKYGVVTAW